MRTASAAYPVAAEARNGLGVSVEMDEQERCRGAGPRQLHLPGGAEVRTSPRPFVSLTRYEQLD